MSELSDLIMEYNNLRAGLNALLQKRGVADDKEALQKEIMELDSDVRGVRDRLETARREVLRKRGRTRRR